MQHHHHATIRESPPDDSDDTSMDSRLESDIAPAPDNLEAQKNGATAPDGPVPDFRVAPGTSARLDQIDANQSEHYRKKRAIERELAAHRARIAVLQERLYAERQRSLLIVLQAMDTGGKDGTIRNVFQGVNPQGCQVWSFKVPSVEESEHDFLWRYNLKTPSRGMITIFNRSHYEDVLVPRVKGLVTEEVWQSRYQMINDFERKLTLNGTTIVKLFLSISKDEQKRRLESRLHEPEKHWKFDVGDISDRALWKQYHDAYEDAITATSTERAPWYVIPANKKWYRNLVVARTIADTLAAMDPRFPKPATGLERMVVPD